MSTAAKSSYSEVLQDIQDFYVDNAVEVRCPVANLTLKYKPLSIKQLKDFIELQVSAEKDEFGVIPGLRIVDKLNEILVDNCLSSTDHLLEKLTVLDRDAIIVQLRADI